MIYPSDPEQIPRAEDGVIAWAWREFHEEKPTNFEWLPRVPMAKAAFQSMRAAQEFINDKLQVASVDGWIVTGASKRGWTTWMVGVTQCSSCVNIVGIVPQVPIEPNLYEGLHIMWQSYGGWTFEFNDYTEAGIMQWIDDEVFGQLWNFLDPLKYKDRLEKMPKYIILSSDDQFMLFDWTTKYFDELKTLGESKLLIAPNSDHSLRTVLPDVISAASAFSRSIASGNTEQQRPQFDYSWDGYSKTITITVPEDGPQPTSVSLRHAETFSSLRRDFRWNVMAGEDNKNCSLPWVPVSQDRQRELQASYNLDDTQIICSQPIEWMKEDLKETNEGSGTFVGTAPEPEVEGHWVGYFIEVVFPSDSDGPESEYKMTTPGWIYPDTYPFDDCHNETCSNTLV